MGGNPSHMLSPAIITTRLSLGTKDSRKRRKIPPSLKVIRPSRALLQRACQCDNGTQKGRDHAVAQSCREGPCNVKRNRTNVNTSTIINRSPKYAYSRRQLGRLRRDQEPSQQLKKCPPGVWSILLTPMVSILKTISPYMWRKIL